MWPCLSVSLFLCLSATVWLYAHMKCFSLSRCSPSHILHLFHSHPHVCHPPPPIHFALLLWVPSVCWYAENNVFRRKSRCCVPEIEGRCWLKMDYYGGPTGRANCGGPHGWWWRTRFGHSTVMGLAHPHQFCLCFHFCHSYLISISPAYITSWRCGCLINIHICVDMFLACTRAFGVTILHPHYKIY